MNSNLQRLKKLADNLYNFPDIIKEESNGFSEVSMEHGGTCFGWKLMMERGCGVHKWFNSKDSKFPLHSHPAWELIIVYDGEMVLYTEGKKETLKAKDCYYNLPNVPHEAFFPVDTWYITITIPPAEGFPK